MEPSSHWNGKLQLTGKELGVGRSLQVHPNPRFMKMTRAQQRVKFLRLHMSCLWKDWLSTWARIRWLYTGGFRDATFTVLGKVKQRK